jgi:hypothetical protein
MNENDVWRKVLVELEKVNRSLEKVLKIFHRPKSQRAPYDDESKTAKQEDNGGSGVPNTFPNLKPRPQHTKHSNHKWYDPRYYAKRGYDDFWKRGIEFGTFVSLVIYATVTFFQWHDANKNFRAGQRAWITVIRARFTYPPDFDRDSFKTRLEGPVANEPTGILFEFKNDGISPAQKVSFTTSDTALDGKDCKHNNYRDPNTSTVTVGPKETGNVPALGFPEGLSQECLDELNRGEASYVMSGVITYTDILMKSDTLTFAIGTTDSAGDSQHVIPAIKSISNKIQNFPFRLRFATPRGS